jgi:hypothetical protein
VSHDDAIDHQNDASTSSTHVKESACGLNTPADDTKTRYVTGDGCQAGALAIEVS